MRPKDLISPAWGARARIFTLWFLVLLSKETTLVENAKKIDILLQENCKK
jgi:hypothetical protein